MIPDTPSSAASGMVDELRAAILRGTADEVNGQPNGNIITKGCEAAEYVDPEDATSAFVDAIADEIRPLLSAKDRELAEARAAWKDATEGLDLSIEQTAGALKMLQSSERARDEALSALREKEERVKALEEALGPFVRLADSYFYRYETQPGVFRESHENDPDERAVYGINRVEITTGDLRRARSVLSPVSREQRGEEA